MSASFLNKEVDFLILEQVCRRFTSLVCACSLLPMCTGLMSHWNYCGKGDHLNGSVNLPSRLNKFRDILVHEKTTDSKIEHGLLVGDGQESTFRIAMICLLLFVDIAIYSFSCGTFRNFIIWI